MSLIVLCSICIPLGSKNVMVWSNCVFLNWISILRSVNFKSLGDLSFQNSNRWLLNCQVSHFNVKTVEMNSFKGVSNIAGKLWLTNFIETSLIWDGTSLMEFSEQVVEIDNRSCVGHKLMPVWVLWHNFIISFEFRDNLLEIPWECEYISVLLLTESNISSNINVVLLNASLFFWGLFGRCDSCWEVSKSLGGDQWVSSLPLQNSWQHFVLINNL